MRLFTPTALKIHAIGLESLQNASWMEGNFFFIAEEAYEKNRHIFNKTIKNGFLFCLGEAFYSNYLRPHNVIDGFPQKNEDLYFDLYYGLTQLFDFAKYHNLEVCHKDKELSKYIDNLLAEYEKTEIQGIGSQEYMDYLTSMWKTILEDNIGVLDKLKSLYAENYANRVFHDRELCEYISTNLQQSGFGWGDYLATSSGTPKQWIKRYKVPKWAERAVVARDRGDCAICGKHLVYEAEENNIDHIVALSIGGTNDLVNLQLTCPSCNKRKSNKIKSVKSSIPLYLGRIISKKPNLTLVGAARSMPPHSLSLA